MVGNGGWKVGAPWITVYGHKEYSCRVKVRVWAGRIKRALSFGSKVRDADPSENH